MSRSVLLSAAVLALSTALPASAHDDSAGSPHLYGDDLTGALDRPSPNDALAHHDASVANLEGTGYVSDIEKNLELAGRGERLLPQGTTDVWAHDGYAYLGTFNAPCSEGDTANGSGVRIYNVKNNNRPIEVNAIATPAGSRANDVKVATMGSGDILVHSNEACNGGPGGFEIYNIDNPLAPRSSELGAFRRDQPAQ